MIKNRKQTKLIMENWRKFMAEGSGPEPVVHIQDWLIGKLKGVHSMETLRSGNPEGSVFQEDIDSVVQNVKGLLTSGEYDVESIANSTGAIEVSQPGVGYDLVGKVEAGQVLNPVTGRPISGRMTKTVKAEGPNKIEVDAIETDEPLSSFSTDKMTIIVRPFSKPTGAKNPDTGRDEMEPVAGEYIVLSIFPGGDVPRTSTWNGEYAVIVPRT